MKKLLYVSDEKKNDSYSCLQQALSSAMKLLPEDNVTILVEKDIAVSKAITLSAQNMPQTAHGITVRGVNHAKISGGVALNGFQLWKKENGCAFFTLSLPALDRTRHLYIDGKSAPRPRTPMIPSSAWNKLEHPDFHFADKIAEHRQGDRGSLEEYKGILTNHTEYLDFICPEDIEMVCEVGWTHNIIPIRSIEKAADNMAYIHPAPVAFRSCQLKGGVQIGPCPNYLENVFEMMQTPGEWYFNRKEHILYLCLAENDLPENHEIILPVTEELLRLEGTLSHKIAGITFENLQFCDTTFLLPATEGYPEIQANILVHPDTDFDLNESSFGSDMYVKTHSAIQLHAAKGISFRGCTFTNLGNGALDVEYGTEDTSVTNCEFFDIAGSAMQIGDFNLRDSHPADRRETVRNTIIYNCYIHHTGLDYKGSAAICSGYAQDLTISHCEICYVPYTAISIGWGWATADMTMDDRENHLAPASFPRWKEPSVSKRNRVLYNHIHHAMQRLHDGGAVYTLGVMEGSAVIGNLIHDSAGYVGDGYNGFSVSGVGVEPNPEALPFHKRQGFPGGIYMDEGSVGIEARNNILYNIAVPFFYHNQIRDGYKKVTVEDNFINRKPGDNDYPQDIADFAGLLFQDKEKANS